MYTFVFDTTLSTNVKVSAVSDSYELESQATTFYTLADFGSAMQAGDMVSLNISIDSTLFYDSDRNGSAVSTGADSTQLIK